MDFIVDFVINQTTLWIKWCSQLFSQILFLHRFHWSPERWPKRWRTQNVLTKCGINTPQNDWNQIVSWMIYYPWINSVIMVLKTFKAKGIFTPEYSIRWKRRTSVRSRSPVSNLTKQDLWDNYSNRQRVIENTRDGSSRLLRFCSVSEK